eukprot:3915619-Rhodomonas_salina.2
METEKRNAQRQNSSMQEVDNEDGTEETEALADFRMHLLDLGENEKQPDAPSEPIPAVVEILEQMRNRLQDGAESMLGTEGERKPIDKNNADKSLRNDGIVITHQKNLLGRTGGSPRATSPLGRANGQLDSPLVQQSPSAGRESVVIVTHKKSLAGRTGSGGGSDGSPVTGTLKPLGSPVGGSPINGTLKGLGSPVTGSPPNASPKDLFRQRVGLQSPTRYACLRLVELRAGKVQAELLVRMAKYKEAMDRCTRLLEHVMHSLTELEVEDHPLGWECRVLKGYCLCGQGDYDKAAATFQACITAVEESQSINVRLAARTMGLCYRGLGLVREVLQDFIQASHFYNEANSATSSITEAFAHPDMIQDDLLALRARWKAGLLDEPVEAFEDAIKRLTDVLGPDHPTVSVAKMDLGDLLLSMSKLDEAEALFAPSREALSRTCGNHHPLFGRVSASMAKVRHEAGVCDSADAKRLSLT